MPRIGKMKFSYTKKGKEAAKRYAKTIRKMGGKTMGGKKRKA